MTLFLVVLIACVMWVAPAVSAAVIELNSGEKVQGKVLKEDKTSILVDVGIDTPVTYFRDEIKAVLKDPEPSPTQTREAAAQADDLEARAVGFIDDGRMNEGLDLFRQAVMLSPTAQRHLNYGSILFGNGVEAYKSGQREQGITILHQAETELNKAVKGFDAGKDAAFLGQAYFLLGEMHANAFGDPAKAGTYYRKAVDVSGHDGAKAALERLTAAPAGTPAP